MRKKEHFNARVAKARGADWAEKLKQGKIDSKMNPSLLYNARVLSGLRQGDIAKKLDMSLSSYCAVERGHRMVKEIFAMLIATIVNRKVESLFELGVDETTKYRAILTKPILRGEKDAKSNGKQVARPRVSPESQSSSKIHRISGHAK
jgi:transcriptional regulator with XRE-family HTH domain